MFSEAIRHSKEIFFQGIFLQGMPFQEIFQNTLFQILVTFLHNRIGFLHYEMPNLYICMKYDFPFYLTFFIFYLFIIRHTNFSIVPKLMKKVRSWRSLESSVGVLRLRKFDKIRYFHRKTVCAHLICKTRSAAIKFQLISNQKPRKN